MKQVLTLFGIAAVVILAFTLFLHISNNGHFRLVRTDPKNGSHQVSYNQSVIFYFNRNLATQTAPKEGQQHDEQYLEKFTYGLSNNIVEVSPSVPGKVNIDGNKLIFQPGVLGFSVDTDYTIKLEKIKSVGGETIPDITITFRVSYVPFNNLSSDQQNQQLNQTDQYHDTNSPRNKFIQSLPYSTNGYRIEYLQSNDYFLVSIINTPVSTQKEAALRYMSNHGIDTKQDKITYFIARGL